MNNEERDRTLKEWVVLNKPAPEDTDALIRRITLEARRVAHENRFSEAWSEPVTIWSKLSYASLGAMIAISVCIVFMRMSGSSTQTAGKEIVPASMAGISAEQLQSNSKLFGEMKRLFPDGLRWIAQSDEEVGLGIEETRQDETAAKSSPMMVKVTVLSRKTGDTVWHQAWNADLILHGQDMVEIVPDRKLADNKLSLWVYPLDDGKLAVDSSISLRLPVTIASRLNAVVTPGEPAEMASLLLDGVEYRIFQTVEIIKGKI